MARMSKAQHEHKQLTEQLLSLDADCDALALQAKWAEMRKVERVLDEVKARLRARGLNPEKLLNGAKGRKTVSSRTTTHWSDDEPFDDLLDTGKSTNGKGGWKGFSSYTATPKCAHSHPLLTIGDEKLQIQGGSAYSPQGKWDVEIMLCGGAKTPDLMLPWGPTFVRLPIIDQSVPSDRDTFDKLIDWTIEQMKAEKRVHVGCIGGHGRTGLFLAVLVHRITGQADATQWLRDNYCKKAVESKAQVNWLHKHYGIEKVDATKAYTATTKSEKSKVGELLFKGKDKTHTMDVAVPIAGRSVWGTTKWH